MPYLILAALLTAGIGWHLWQDRQVARQLKDALAENVSVTGERDDAVDKLEKNRSAIADCEAANDRNAAEAERMRMAANAATGQVVLQRAEHEQRLANIKRELDEHKNDLDCPALTPEYRQQLLNHNQARPDRM